MPVFPQLHLAMASFEIRMLEIFWRFILERNFGIRDNSLGCKESELF